MHAGSRSPTLLPLSAAEPLPPLAPASGGALSAAPSFRRSRRGSCLLGLGLGLAGSSANPDPNPNPNPNPNPDPDPNPDPNPNQEGQLPARVAQERHVGEQAQQQPTLRRRHVLGE